MATINEALTGLYNNINNDADTTFLVHGTEVKAHKFIIAARSPTFDAMFNTIFVPVDGRHRIDDKKITVQGFREFLRFLYLDMCNIQIGNVGGLFHMAQMYFVPLLKRRCIEFVAHESHSFANAIRLYELGKRYEREFPEMVKLAIENIPLENLAIHPISAEMVQRIVKDRPRGPRCTEDYLMRIVFQWSKVETDRQNLPNDRETIKHLLLPIVKHINLQNASYKTWADIVHPFELATPKECALHLAAFVHHGR